MKLVVWDVVFAAPVACLPLPHFFSPHSCCSQGGRFDHPDRLFHSVRDAWLSASKLTMTDVKELIPEFFFLPNFLDNVNGSVRLGCSC